MIHILIIFSDGKSSAALAWTWPEGQRCVTRTNASSSPRFWLSQLTLLSLWESSNPKASNDSHLLLDCLFLVIHTPGNACSILNQWKNYFWKYIYQWRQILDVRSQWVVNNRLDDAKEIKNDSKITAAAVVTRANPSPLPSCYLDRHKTPPPFVPSKSVDADPRSR